MNGVLVTDKPAGWTSHDVVAAVKKKLKAKKVGHLGTLDPMATGVLPLVINGATKHADALGGGTKEYSVVLELGSSTDTYDSSGKVTRTAPLGDITPEDVVRALKRFTGRITQLPPMYSAVKRNGVPLYRLARKGVTVEREPREAEVFSLVVTETVLPVVRFTAVCSRGTYIRSICHDLGEMLGCGAHMTSLVRTRSGCFTLDGAVSPGAPPEELAERIIPLPDALERARRVAPEGSGAPA